MASLTKRSMLIAGHPTSISLEAPFWRALKRLAGERGISVTRLVTEIDAGRDGNLSSAIRLHILDDLERRAGLAPATADSAPANPTDA